MFIENNRTSAAGSDVNTENWNEASYRTRESGPIAKIQQRERSRRSFKTTRTTLSTRERLTSQVEKPCEACPSAADGVCWLLKHSPTLFSISTMSRWRIRMRTYAQRWKP